MAAHPAQNGHEVDPKSLPRTIADRKKLADELSAKSRAALARGELLAASMHATDALMLFPNDRAQLDLFDDITQATNDPLGLFPVATGAVHVATAAGRARVLMTQMNFAEAIPLMGRVLEVAPELAYFDWVRRWLVARPPTIAELGWDTLMGAVVKPALTMALAVPVPADRKPSDDEDPRLENVRAAAAIFGQLIETFPDEKILWFGVAMMRRRLGETAACIAAAEEGVNRFPEDWGMRTALLNALRDAKRPDEALAQARKAMQLDPEDGSALHDAAWGFLDAGRAGEAAQLFDELLRKDPNYPGGTTCLHYARVRAGGSEADRHALLDLRDKHPWDDDAVRLADLVDPPVPYITVLPRPQDASAHYAHMLVRELGHVMQCCGRGANVSVAVQSMFPESPSVPIAFDVALRAVGAGGAQMGVEVERAQQPDPRADKGRVAFPIFGPQLSKVYPQGDPRAQQEVARVAALLFRRDVWDPAAHAIATAALPAGLAAVNAFLSVMTNPPPPPAGPSGPVVDGVTWTYRCQVAAAVILSHFGPWDSGPGRAALYSMVSGPSDWVTIAGIVGLAWRAHDNPQVSQEVAGAFQWLRSLIPVEGFTPWEHALVHAWRTLPGLPDPVRADLDDWAARYDQTIETKNAVRTLRRYGGMTIEEYAQSQMNGGPTIAEWQEALNASPGLMDRFLEVKREIGFAQMGVSSGEKAALDDIIQGNMDMHLRMAQAQQAQSALNDANADPDPVVFPGQRVARLSDYVRILKGMQTGNMMGALAEYGLDMMSYGQVAQVWAAKMAADPVLTEKFSRMMQSR